MVARRPDYDTEDALAVTGERVSQWRRLLGLTQQQVAERAGISRGAVVRIEAGDPGPSVDTFFRVLNALHIADQVTDALDPMRTAVGMARAEEKLPRRVRRS
ncbi:MAG: helix-turn-helix transcriptional regulator [Actinomycetes bacterium]